MLPRSVLASIIVVALKGMLMQIKDLKRFHREGILETLVWIITFLGVILIDIDVGLLIGVGVSLVALYIKGWKTYYSMLGTIPETAIYVDLKIHKRAVEVPQTKIFHYVGSVNFANKADFKKALFDEIGVNTKLIRRASLCAGSHENVGLKTTRTLILDLTSVPHIDTAACKMFDEIKKEVKFLGITTLISGPSDCVFDSLRHANEIGIGHFLIFPSVHDAILYSQSKLDMV
jgi:solute carrier family 26 protein